ncbi:MAG: lysophospholipid acyltransferase family protein [Sulfuriferula sp.]
MELDYFFSAYMLRPLRIVFFIALIAAGLMILAFIFPYLSQLRRGRIIQGWTRVMLRTLGIRLQISGTPPVGAALMVANHVSWVDPFLLMARHAMCFVAKAEIRDWPVFGWLAAQAGTVFIRRDRLRDLVKVAQAFVAHLAAGSAVGLFPESTTTDGTRLLPFKAALFQVAINAKADCYPVAIHYDNSAAIWIEDMGLLSSFWRVMAQPRITAHITYCPAIRYQAQTRQNLASASASAIASALCLPVPHTPPEISADLPVLTH